MITNRDRLAVVEALHVSDDFGQDTTEPVADGNNTSAVELRRLDVHQVDVDKHVDEAMGFPHDKTTHHFRLYSDGGAIEVIVNDSKDSQNIQAIRSHLTHIVAMFSNGEFSIPMFVHDQVPPGVPVMKEKRTEISYGFEELPTGGAVRIKTTNPDALTAVYDFLSFQIADHHTGDTTEIPANG